MDITRWSTPKPDWLHYLQPKMEKPYTGSDGKVSVCNAEDQVRSLDWEDPLEKEMAAYSSILAWEISWIEEPRGLQYTESQRVGHALTTEQQQDHQETLCFCLLPCLSSVWTAVTMNRSSINFLFSAPIFLSGSLFQKTTELQSDEQRYGITNPVLSGQVHLF